MSDDKKIIFSMVGVSKQTPQGKQIIKNLTSNSTLYAKNLQLVTIIRFYKLKYFENQC